MWSWRTYALVWLGASLGASLDRRIVGGYDAPQRYSWMALITTHNKQVFCGGVAYTANLIFTAAHCRFWFTIGQSQVYVGLRKLQEKGRGHTLRHMIFHKNFSKNTLLNYDLAILKTDAMDSAPQILLDDGRWGFDSTLVRTAGWGLMDVNDGTSRSRIEFPNLLQEVILPIVPSKECQKVYPKTKDQEYFDPVLNFCTGFPASGHGACQNDSGGPVFIKSGQWAVLVGITSWGIGCAYKDYYDVVVRIQAFKPWIETIAGCIGRTCHQDSQSRILFSNGSEYFHRPLGPSSY